MVIHVKIDGKMVNFDISSGNNDGLGEKILSLENGNKDVELDGITEKIRVLEGEGLRIAKAGFDGLDVNEAGVGGLSLNEGDVDMGSEKVRNEEKAGLDGTVVSETVSELVLVEGNLGRESGEESKIRVLEGEKVEGLRNEKTGSDGSRISEAVVSILVLDGGNKDQERDEKVRIEEGVKGLRKEKAGVDGSEISEAGVDEGNVDKESDEVTKFDRLMIENKVLEREKSAALREVEVWKRKCEEFEYRVRELEERLSRQGQGKDDVSTEVKEGTKNVNVGNSSNVGSASCSRILAIPSKMKEAIISITMRDLELCYERSSDQKVVPSSATVMDIGSDHELSDEEKDPTGNTPKRKRDLTVVTSDDELEENETDKITDEISGEGNDPIGKTPKRKRDVKVVTSDDELDEHEITMPKGRGLKIDNIDNESEEEDDDDTLPISQLFKKVESNCQSDDEDNIPISQLNKNRAFHTQNHPRRRLVKRAQNERSPKRKISLDGSAMKYVDDEKSGEDDSESDSLSDFIVQDDTNVEDLEDDSSENSDEQGMASDDNICFIDILSTLRGRKGTDSEWALEADMLSDLGKDFELCMRGVCALYRRQITKEDLWNEGDYQMGQGFSKYDAPRGKRLGYFLTDGNVNGGVVKSVEELELYFPHGAIVCQNLATRYSNQLFEIYQIDEDQFFP